jgi:ABC-type multidrug transport system permease subunit
MAGLASTASQFFISILVLWVSSMATYAFFRALSAWFKTLDDATKVTGLAIQVVVVYTGYLIPPMYMHPWIGWLRWVNWIQYAFECLMANEFSGREMPCVSPDLVPLGPNATSQYQSCSLVGSTPGSSIVSGDAYIGETFGYTRNHLWRNIGFMSAFFVFFLALAICKYCRSAFTHSPRF